MELFDTVFMGIKVRRWETGKCMLDILDLKSLVVLFDGHAQSLSISPILVGHGEGRGWTSNFPSATPRLRQSHCALLHDAMQISGERQSSCLTHRIGTPSIDKTRTPWE
eukprot:3567901-Amphidinium_carterae.1